MEKLVDKNQQSTQLMKKAILYGTQTIKLVIPLDNKEPRLEQKTPICKPYGYNAV